MYSKYLLALGVAVLALVLINQCWAGDLPTEEEVWATVTEERFGPVIGAEPPGDGYTLTSLASRSITLEDNTSGLWWINQNEAWITDAYPSEDGKHFFVVYRAPGTISYGFDPPNDDVWRDIYGIRDGKIVFLGRQYGKLKIEKETLEFEPYCPDGSCEED